MRAGHELDLSRICLRAGAGPRASIYYAGACQGLANSLPSRLWKTTDSERASDRPHREFAQRPRELASPCGIPRPWNPP
ncbi:hypothetical protein WQQ_05190 [Hydrocarboniphaga effusa AP103]|uniref:Uncharacterized protein n=1 Tax=Hydrocarboniphaga effusa AP103 TaxID=1172194 RepID=I7ZF97_9GAMM|nr:hypothetical protein WQQ_05190 [Hydrocarboniphaga effusa AP103]